MNNLPNSLKTAFFTVLFIFLFLYTFAKLLGPIPLSINSITTTKSDLFSVSGVGEATAIPDTALINFGVTDTAPTVEKAKNQVNQAINSITKGLTNLDIEKKDIKTTNYSIYPNYDYSNTKNTITGYTITQELQVEISPIEKANQAVDLATANGANMLGSIRFTINEEDKAELENKAREEAIKKAREKAIVISRLSGVRLGKIINVYENTTPLEPRMYFDKVITDEIQEEPTQLQPGENTISISVTLSYETY